jgi:hypothetical protein
MNESEKKDRILSFLNVDENRNGFFQLNDLNKLVFKEGFLSETEMRFLVERISGDGLLIDNDPIYKYNFSITPFLESGGYSGKEQRKKFEAEREEASHQKTLNESKLAKWQVKIFWPAFIFTLIGSILGIISFFLQVRK